MNAGYAGESDGEYGDGRAGIWNDDPAFPGNRPPGRRGAGAGNGAPGSAGPGGRPPRPPEIGGGGTRGGRRAPADPRGRRAVPGDWPGRDVPPGRQNPAADDPRRSAGRDRQRDPSRSRAPRAQGPSRAQDPSRTAWPRDPAQQQPSSTEDPASTRPPRPASRAGRSPAQQRRQEDPREGYPGGRAPVQPGRPGSATPGDPPRPRDPYARGYPPGGYPSDPGHPPDAGYPSDAGYPPDERYPAGDRRPAAGGYPPPRDESYAHEGYAPGDGPYPAEDDASWDDGEPGDRFLPGFGGDEDNDRDTGRGKRRGRKARRGRNDFLDDDVDYDLDTGRGGRGGRGGGGGGGGGPIPKRHRVRWIAPVAALLVIVVPLAVGGFYAYNFVRSKYFPADYSGAGSTPQVVVQVKSGDTATSLAPRLQTLGVVASSRAFVLAAEHSANTSGLEAGFYRLNHHMKASLAYQELLNPKDRVQITVTFPEGLRSSQVAVVLGERSGIPLGDYQHALSNPARLGLPSYAQGKPEGYLFPATYQIQPNATALTVLQAMVRRFDQEATAINLQAAAARVHLTSTQAIIVASLVQAEGGRLTDYPKIARVVYNRLAKHMKLQFDSTVFYGLGLFGTAATDKEISTPGPYNTYLNFGLPPGPIDNPGDAAIRAALHPAPGNWLYFISFKNGTTEFSPTPFPGQ